MPKLLLLGNHFFVCWKTANFSTACGTVTLKSPLSRAFFTPHVHLRLRKCRSRCTLDCGFKTSESPALRGFVGGLRALATAALYLVLLSNGLHLSKNFPVKFGFSPKPIPANIAKKLPPQRCSKLLFIAVFQLLPQTAHVRFTPESEYTLGPAQRIAHNGSHGETGAFRTGPLSLPSERSARSQISPGWVSERRTLPLWDLGREVLSKNAESLRDSDALMRVAVPKASRPRWAALLCLQLGDVAVLSLCAQYFLNVRGVGGITTLGALCVFSKRWTTACQRGYPLLVRLHPSVIRAICNLHNVANITL